MNPIIIVAETGSDITPELAAKYNITLVPMHVTFDSHTMDDGSFPVQKICDYYKETGKLPRTSGCSPDDFMLVFDAIHTAHPNAQILYLAYSAVTTCSGIHRTGSHRNRYCRIIAEESAHDSF